MVTETQTNLTPAHFYGTLLGVVFFAIFVHGVQAYTQYAPGSLLQPDDVTTSHIRNETIANIDISKTAAIDVTKLRDPSSGLLVFSSFGKLATTTLLNVATTTEARLGIGTTTPSKALSVKGDGLFDGSVIAGNLTATTSITMASTTYSVPTADGSLNQVLTTNGSKVLSWATPSSTASATSTSVLSAASSLRRTQTAAYVKVKEWNIGTTGNYLVVFDLAMEAGATNCKAQVYLNDVATTTEVTVTSSSFATQTKTVYGLAVNDLIAIKTKSFDTNLGCDLQNAKIQGGFIPTVTNTLD